MGLNLCSRCDGTELAEQSVRLQDPGPFINTLCSLLISVINVIEEEKQVKGSVHPKNKMSLCFTLLRRIRGVCDFLLSDESDRSYIKNDPGPSKPYNGTERVLAGSCSEDLK